MSDDKRCHDRIESDGIVFYSHALKDDDSNFHEKKHKGFVVDISPAGICIITDQELEVGSKVQFDIHEYVKGTHVGVVKRCVRNYDIFHVGLEVPFYDNVIMGLVRETSTAP
jgi:hypothetical protein